MEIISFWLSEADLHAVYRLHFKASFKTRKMRVTLLSCFLFFAIVGMITAQDNGAISLISSSLAYIVFGFIAIGIAWCVMYLGLSRKARRIFLQQKSLHDKTEVSWSESELNFKSERGSTKYFWSDFVRIVEDRDMIVLYQSDNLMNFIPKRVLTSEQIQGIGIFRDCKAG